MVSVAKSVITLDYKQSLLSLSRTRTANACKRQLLRGKETRARVVSSPHVFGSPFAITDFKNRKTCACCAGSTTCIFKPKKGLLEVCDPLPAPVPRI